MSWDIFKQQMVRYGQNQRSVDVDGYARTFAREYDQCVKRGFDTVNQIPLQQGNTQLLEQSANNIFTSQQISSNQSKLIQLLGTSVLSYWGGGVMANFPIPIIPAPGSASNVSVNGNVVLNPGVWSLDFPLTPTTSPNGWIDFFIIAARTHLQTVSGLITTTSLYPPIGTPGPGFIFWTGYTIP